MGSISNGLEVISQLVELILVITPAILTGSL
ncbi:hypothetical protein JOE26_002341 [Rhodococcus coprophilus]|uniref:Uncharacterized protein n=1 Tax=Rhodococcus coprophilus TaxID=38310 RepID=A0A2X4UAZ0_9NOCA|nr:hypothetical protein [Rhodococcus coprophilus]SQI36977.1 Uncharacterised protein [Rhodococcus coprophilus]